MKVAIGDIKERLNKLIPSRKWITEITYMDEPGYEQFIKKINIIHKEGKTVYVIARMDWSNPPKDTAEFIAHAPEDMQFLLNTIEAQQQEIERLNFCKDHVAIEVMQENETLRQEIQQLQAQNEAMREALAQFKYEYEQGANMQSNYHDVCELLRNTTFKAGAT